MILMLFLTEASHHVFVRTWSFGDAYTYQEVWRATFGPRFTWFPSLCIAFAFLVCDVTELWNIQSFCRNFITTLWPNAPPFLSNIWLLQYLGAFFFSLPCFFVDSVSWFSWIAWVGLFVSITTVVCLAFHAIRTEFAGFYATGKTEIPLAYWDFELDYSVLDYFNAAFFAHPMVTSIVKEMRRPTRNRILAATWIANAILALCIFLIPTFGYLAQGGTTEKDNVFHLLEPLAAEVIVGKLAVLVNVMCSGLLFTFFMARTVVGQILPAAEFQKLPVGITAWVSCVLSICINFLGDFPMEIFLGVSSLSFSVVGFVLPPVFFFAQYGVKNVKWALVAGGVLVVGGGMMILSFVITIQNLIEMR